MSLKKYFEDCSVITIFITMMILSVVIFECECSPAVSSSSPNSSSGKSVRAKKAISAESPNENLVSSSSKSTKNGTGTVSHFSMEEIVRQVITASHAVEHLEKMKNRLLVQFENKTGEFATARGGYGGYGAYGFPSLEGALLSLAFLTFAVFLIDLIQQLLSRFRTGTAGVVPLVGRRKRSFFPEDDEDQYQTNLLTSVLKSIENPLHFFK